MFDHKSDYALNKLNPDAIVYKSATGAHIRLAPEDFNSNEEFLKWKELSDELYYEIEQADTRYAKKTNNLLEYSAFVESPEDTLVEMQEQAERQKLCRLLMNGLDVCLTPLQRRRLWMYCVDGMTVRQIATAEHVSHPSIVECLITARKKLQKFLKNRQ